VEAVGLKDEGIEFGVEFVELAGGFVEVFVVKLGDAPLFAFHLGGAVVVEFLGGGADLLDKTLIPCPSPAERRAGDEGKRSVAFAI
jgi:hypothetical protein